MAKKIYAREIDRLREICLALPGATEKLSHGEPTWFAGPGGSGQGRGKVFCMLANDHHDDGIVGFWTPAPPGVQEAMVEEDPDRFYRPPYVGVKGWLGVRIDVSPDWHEIAAVVEDGYRLVAPKKLLAELGAQPRLSHMAARRPHRLDG